MNPLNHRRTEHGNQSQPQNDSGALRNGATHQFRMKNSLHSAPPISVTIT
jgi:hypothetical protein